MKVVLLLGSTPVFMSSMVDKQFLTLLAPNTTYLLIASEGQFMHTLFDIGSNVTLLHRKLRKQLGLNKEEYALTFQDAAGAIARFFGRLFNTRLQLHDLLDVTEEGIRIIDGAADCMSIIFGPTIFYPRRRFFRQLRMEEGGHQVVVNIKVAGTRIVCELSTALPQVQ